MKTMEDTQPRAGVLARLHKISGLWLCPKTDFSSFGIESFSEYRERFIKKIFIGIKLFDSFPFVLVRAK